MGEENVFPILILRLGKDWVPQSFKYLPLIIPILPANLQVIAHLHPYSHLLGLSFNPCPHLLHCTYQLTCTPRKQLLLCPLPFSI